MIKDTINNMAKNLYARKDSKALDYLANYFINDKKKQLTFHHYNLMNEEIKDELYDEFDKIFSMHSDQEHWFYVKKFEKRYAGYLGKRYAVGTSSGATALQLSLLVSGIREGDEVITVPNTFIATALAISSIGAKPVFIDISKENYNMDPVLIENAITSKTKAIIPVHLYGNPCDMDAIRKVSQAYNLSIIEDCCQAHGAMYHSKKVPFTDIGCFSFNTSKILGGMGNGGMILSNDYKIKDMVEAMIELESNSRSVSLNKIPTAKLDIIQAAILNVKLNHLHAWVIKRRENATVYNELLQEYNVICPQETNNAKSVYSSYVIRSINRDRLKNYLNNNHIETNIEYKVPIHLTKAFINLGYHTGNFPVTEKICKEMLSLPISPFLTEIQIGRISKLIIQFFRN